jgi:hypothetical protein
VNLGREIVHGFEWLWYQIERGALKAALAVVEPFSHLPSFLGGWAREAKDAMQAQLDQLHAPNMAWGNYAEKAGAYDGSMWKKGFLGGIAGLVTNAFSQIGKALHDAADKMHHHHRRHAAAYAIPEPPTPPASGVFGPPPPFTSTSSSTAHHRHHMTAAQRRQLALQFVLDKAILAVQKAQVGSKAWDKAIKAEEAALAAEIRYWDKRAHDADLSKKARDEALRKEIAYQRELNTLEKQLAKQTHDAIAANEKQFLAEFAAIESSFASNAQPAVNDGGGVGKSNTHLYDLKNIGRETNKHLKAIRTATRFPSTRSTLEAVGAVGG